MYSGIPLIPTFEDQFSWLESHSLPADEMPTSGPETIVCVYFSMLPHET